MSSCERSVQYDSSRAPSSTTCGGDAHGADGDEGGEALERPAVAVLDHAQRDNRRRRPTCRAGDEGPAGVRAELW
eukprot:364235-Chlamydomonas_euryale.AAC.7